MASFQIDQVPTKPIEGQKTGTSGLRKKVKLVKETPNYVENFIQSVINTLLTPSLFSAPTSETKPILVVGGDGRYFNKEAIQIITKMFYANAKELLETRFPSSTEPLTLYIGQNGIMSTPAVSSVIRTVKAGLGGIILTASHNPGGPEEDWGIKYNAPNGGPAIENITDKIYEHSIMLTHYNISKQLPDFDLSKINEYDFVDHRFRVQIIDSVDIYLSLMKEVFDFAALKKFIATRKDFNFLFDAMNGVTGVYATRIFAQELGMDPAKSLLNCTPQQDFGGLHPDPNLTYAKELVDQMYNGNYDLGAASDGDGDRNMILGRKFFVTPSDSVAIIAEYATQCIPYFKRTGLKGLARSMPTSTAIDRVAKALGVKCYETPTGWKFFGNLMDSGNLSICGEESFGTGSDHIREKDGIFAVLCWLSILAYRNQSTGEKETLVPISTIVKEHWKKYGRSFYTRYDYEGVESEKANTMMQRLGQLITSKQIVSPDPTYQVSSYDDFAYTDPIDNSYTKNQGIRIHFTDGSRVVFRLSGTGSSGATIRLYMETYMAWEEGNPENNKKILEGDAKELVKPLFEIANTISQLQQLSGRNSPTVIT